MDDVWVRAGKSEGNVETGYRRAQVPFRVPSLHTRAEPEVLLLKLGEFLMDLVDFVPIKLG